MTDHFAGRLAFYGDITGTGSDALTNTYLAHELDSRGYTIIPYDQRRETAADYTIHHVFVSDFLDFVPPEAGYCIAWRTWDFGRFPRLWVDKINATFDQLWAYSNWIGQHAIDSGIDPERVKIAQLGIDPAVYHPDGPIYSVPTDKSFKFIFVGGAVARKGIDILLKAYRQAFTKRDDVCLVIKDHSDNIIYRERTFKQQILDLSKDELQPEIAYIDEFLPTDQLASLYRACNVGVFPYRAEGFCLPILEAMACGVPSIVPNLGPCLDFCSPQSSFIIPAKRINVPVFKGFKLSLGFEEFVEEIDFPEVQVDTLARALRETYEASAAELSVKADEGVQIAQKRFTWKQSADRIDSYLRELGPTGLPYRFRVGVESGRDGIRG